MTRPALILALAAFALPVAAEPAKVTILPGWRMENGNHMAGLEIALAPGWKTYWRQPGEAGIPPSFDLSGSNNVAGIRVHWPVPAVYRQSGMRSIGYVDSVVLPIELTPERNGAPMDLRLAVDMGVCLDICVPVTASVEADLAGDGPDARISAALADRPFDETEAGVSRVTCDLSETSEGSAIEVSITMPSLGGVEEMVLEPEDRRFWVSEPLARREDDALRATARLQPPRGEELNPDLARLRLTVIGTNGAVDIRGCD